jgi:hypothetical protein
MMNDKYCKDCSNYRPDARALDGMSQCAAPQNDFREVSLVTGQGTVPAWTRYCASLRVVQDGCGREARWFAPGGQV